MDADPRHAAWRGRYAAAQAALPGWASGARPTLLGFSACIDAYVRLDEAQALFAPDVPLPAKVLAEALLTRVRSGTGGEILHDWPEGDAWLAATLAHATGAGGASAQIANALAILGAPTMLALGDRSGEQLSVLHQGIGVAEDTSLRRLSQIVPRAQGRRARHWIFETPAGTRIGDDAITRSTRVIVRLADDLPQVDPAFEALSVDLAPRAGAAALSSLVATPEDDLPAVLDRIAGLARRWREAGLDTLHIELADYGTRPHVPGRILAALRGLVTSAGMSLSEWRVIAGSPASSPETLVAFARHHGLQRICVHADDWALAVTRRDPGRETAALLAGCLLAGDRAATGRPGVPAGLAPEAVLGEAPPAGPLGEGWAAVSVPAPYLRRPRSTIGLGDTFVAGTLLVLGQPADAAFPLEFMQGEVP